MNYHDYRDCINACLRAAALCNHCASSCLQEEDVKMMADCIQLDMECAAVCYTAAQLMSLGSKKAAAFSQLCSDLCGECAAECDKHENTHCKECAAACRDCAEACTQMTEPIEAI